MFLSRFLVVDLFCQNTIRAATRRSQIAAAILFDLGTVDFAEWGLIQANARRGVFRVKILTAVRLPAPRIVAPRFREKTGMKEATKRATSATLAHMLAVTAMLVIASVLFYGSGHRAANLAADAQEVLSK
jgi:hypothetical protein